MAPEPPGVTFSLNGVSGLVNSNILNTASFFNANVTGGVDAGDTVTFAVVVENQGGAPAYDIKLEDVIPDDGSGNPSCYTLDMSSLKVTRGTGAVVAPPLYTVTPTASGGKPGFTITTNTLPTTPPTQIPLADFDPANDSNVVVITFKGTLLKTVTPGCCTDTASLKTYTSQLGGPDFVSSGLSPKPSDTADVCVKPKAQKCVSAISEQHTQPDSSTFAGPAIPAAVGEIVTFHLQTNLPEGVSPSFKIQENLPPGMTYLPGTAKLSLMSDQGIGITVPALAGALVKGSKADCKSYRPTFPLPASQVTPATFGPGVSPTFDLGTLTNNDLNDNNPEYVIVEFNALVNNVPSNVNNTTLSNTYSVLVGSQPSTVATSDPSNVTVVEPAVGVSKSIGPPNANGLRPFSITLNNTGGADAFDVRMTDTMPNPVVLWGGSPTPTVTASPAACVSPLPAPVLNTTTNTITLDLPSLPKGCGVTLTFYVRPGSECFTNTASVAYSSLPGPAGTQPNATGSVTPCDKNAGSTDCERLYTASGQASVTTGCAPAACADVPQPTFGHMVSWWPLDETAGNTVVDIKGGHSGTTSGTVGASPSVAPAPKVGGALYFGNSNATVPGAPYNFGTGSFTVDAWVRPTLLTNAVGGVVDKLDTGGTPQIGFAFFVRNVGGSGQLQLVMGTSTYASAGSIPYNNAWQHVAVTVQRGGGAAPVGTFYINGAAAGTFSPSPTDVSSQAALLIGSSRLNGLCQSCEVALDEVEIFDDAVPPDLINAIYSAGSAGKCKPAPGTAKPDGVKANGPPPHAMPSRSSRVAKERDKQ